MASSTTSNHLFNKQLGHILKGSEFIPPTTLYVGLFTTVPQLNGAGGTEVSTSGTSYARVPIQQNTGWQGPSGTNQEYSNSGDIVWSTPSGNWGTIQGCGIFDAAEGGNLYWVGYLTTSKSVTSGDGAPKILANALKISRATC